MTFASPGLLDVVRMAFADVADAGGRAALIGGLAVGVHALPRTTRDADLAVSVADDPAAERIVADLRARGYALVLSLEQTAVHRLATVRLISPVDHRTLVDLLFASNGIEPEIVAAAEQTEVAAGWRAPVARPGHLVAMKVLSRGPDRPQDDQDLQALLARITPPELARARIGVESITTRGFARGKSLAVELDSLIERFGAA